MPRSSSCSDEPWRLPGAYLRTPGRSQAGVGRGGRLPREANRSRTTSPDSSTWVEAATPKPNRRYTTVPTGSADGRRRDAPHASGHRRPCARAGDGGEERVGSPCPEEQGSIRGAGRPTAHDLVSSVREGLFHHDPEVARCVPGDGDHEPTLRLEPLPRRAETANLHRLASRDVVYEGRGARAADNGVRRTGEMGRRRATATSFWLARPANKEASAGPMPGWTVVPWGRSRSRTRTGSGRGCSRWRSRRPWAAAEGRPGIRLAAAPPGHRPRGASRPALGPAGGVDRPARAQVPARERRPRPAAGAPLSGGAGAGGGWVRWRALPPAPGAWASLAVSARWGRGPKVRPLRRTKGCPHPHPAPGPGVPRRPGAACRGPPAAPSARRPRQRRRPQDPGGPRVASRGRARAQLHPARAVRVGLSPWIAGPRTGGDSGPAASSSPAPTLPSSSASANSTSDR